MSWQKTLVALVDEMNAAPQPNPARSIVEHLRYARTVRLNPGRRVGKTFYIREQLMRDPSAATLVGSPLQAKLDYSFCDRKQVFAATDMLAERLRGRRVKTVFVDEPRLCFLQLSESAFYDAWVAAGANTFIFLGE